MTALPVSAREPAVREAVGRLSTVESGPYEIVSCYLKLEPRDKARAKYLIKIKNRIKHRASDLERRPLDHAQRESVRADLDRLRRYFEEPSRLPAARGIALFACDVLDLFETLPLPHVQRPPEGLVAAGMGVDGSALFPHLHTYLHDLVLGVVRLNPKRVAAADVREAALALREQRERAWERAHAEAVREGVGSGWAVNGIEPTLKALERGQGRTLLADGQDDDRRIDDAIEEALAQHLQVDVVYDERARRVVDGLAGLLRFRR